MDTVVHGLFTPIATLPPTLSAIGMMGIQAAIHLPVPSTSSQAVLTLPLLVPLSDLIGLSRQTAVLAYQYGAGLCEIVTPTNGALMAMLAAAGVRYEEWLKFVAPDLRDPDAAWRRSRWRWLLQPGSIGNSSGSGGDQPFEIFMSASPTCRPAPCRPGTRSPWGSPGCRNGERVSRVCFGIELEDEHLPGALLGQLIERRRHHLAGAAPVGVEVHQHRNAGVANGAIELLIGHLLRPVETDWLSALGALWAGSQPGQIHPVGGRAEGALHDDRTGAWLCLP